MVDVDTMKVAEEKPFFTITVPGTDASAFTVRFIVVSTAATYESVTVPITVAGAIVTVATPRGRRVMLPESVPRQRAYTFTTAGESIA